MSMNDKNNNKNNNPIFDIASEIYSLDKELRKKAEKEVKSKEGK
jgi:hypothetical protein